MLEMKFNQDVEGKNNLQRNQETSSSESVVALLVCRHCIQFMNVEPAADE